MKTSLKKLLFLFFFCTSPFLTAQEFYISAGGGYALGADKSPFYSWGFSDIFFGKNIQFPLEIEEETPGDPTFRNRLFSYGEGGNAQLTLGYMFGKHIGADLRVSYLFSRKRMPLFAKIAPVEATGESTSGAFYLNPSLVISGGGEKFIPYARAGIVLGMPTIKNKVFANSMAVELLIEDRVSGGVAFGFSSNVGLKYFISDKTAFFGEVNYINMAYNPTKREIVTATQNGIDISGTLYPDGTDIALKKGYTVTPSTPETEQSTHPLPFGSIGMNLGILFSFK